MRRTKVAIAVAVVAMLTGCGDASKEGASNATQPSAYDPNPPFGASDIDATVEETRRRMTTPAPSGPEAGSTPSNGVDPKTDIPARTAR